jgi:hypothetical protein
MITLIIIIDLSWARQLKNGQNPGQWDYKKKNYVQ